MSPSFSIINCTLPTFGGVCFRLNGSKIFYVTAQPLGTPGYQAIAKAGITSVLNVRDSAETNP